MFRTLRNRLVLSHVLPLIIAVPLMGLGLVYTLESQVVLPRLATNLTGDAHLLAEISRTEYELWGDPVLFEIMLSRVLLDPSERVMFLNPEGLLLYSTEPDDHSLLGQPLDLPGLDLARAGQEVALTNYSLFRSNNVLLEVLTPVVSPDGPVLGIVRVTYYLESVYDVLGQLRLLILVILGSGLLLGVVLGLVLALSINRPVQRVTNAIYDLAKGATRQPLAESGPVELRDQARAVNYLVSRLHELEQARKQLLANLVHELGRPLGALRSAIHALSKGAAQDAQLLADLTSGMEVETDRLQVVVEDLAHLHEQVLGDLELKLEPLPLDSWLRRVLAPWEAAAREKHLKVEIHLPPEMPTVLIDPLRLAQVIGNLMDNAIKYTPSDRAITISAGQEGDQAWVCVADTGSGILPEELEKIFMPFYRGGQGRRIKQGMGLGLSIARELAEAHGGRISVVSNLESGSQFTLWLPVYFTGDVT
jgi:two-component system sensor histidine kinase BaeS